MYPEPLTSDKSQLLEIGDEKMDRKINISCKVCRLGKRNGQLLVYTDNLIKQNNSLRKISELVYLKFRIYISKSSVQIHKKHYLQPQPEEQDHSFYSRSAKIVSHY